MTDYDTLENAWVALNRLQLQAHRNIEAALAAAGLPKLDWYDVLWALERSEDGLRPYQMQEELLFEQSGFSRLSTRMAKDELIERVKDTTDGRGLTLRITETGKALRAKMWPVYRDAIAREMQRVKGQKVETDALQKLFES